MKSIIQAILNKKNNKPLSSAISMSRYTIEDLIKHIEKQKNQMPAMKQLLKVYKIKRKFPDMRDFRMGPHMIDKVPFDWIVLYDRGKYDVKRSLIGHAMMSRIFWDGKKETIPDGWQGTVRRSYEDSVLKEKRCNTLVGMFVRIENNRRKQGWAAYLINEMKTFGKKQNLSSLIIPLRLPQRYEKEYAEMPYEEFAFLKREDGQYKDHWLRLHVRLGARILGISNSSHQHAMGLKDFYQLCGVSGFANSGQHLVKLPDGWYQVYVDIERNFVFISQGCIWVQHLF